MSTSEQSKKSSDQGPNAVRETFRKGEARAQETLESAQENLQIASDGASR